MTFQLQLFAADVLHFMRENSRSPVQVSISNLSSSIINLFAVKWYGESEFWLSTGKVALIGIVFFFTFITMVGGNPKHDAYGFRYWKTPVSLYNSVAQVSKG